jgi:hypothetical protein
MYEYVEAARLLAASQPAAWTLHTFVGKNLRAEIDALLTKLEKPSEIGADDEDKRDTHMLAFYLTLSAQVLLTGQSSGNNDDSSWLVASEQLIRTLTDLLTKKKKIGLVESVAAIECLLALGPFNPLECMRVVHEALQQNDRELNSKLPLSTRRKLSAVYELVKSGTVEFNFM